MNSFFNRSLKSILLAFAAVAALAFTGVASAQQATSTCVSGCLPPAPVAPAMGITVGGWVQSGAVGVGETTGIGNKAVTGEVVTRTDEKFTLGATTFLTGTAYPDRCSVNCADAQSKLEITGTSLVGAASVGYAKGEGMPTGNAPVAASMSSTGTNGMFNASLMQRWVGTPAPATAP